MSGLSLVFAAVVAIQQPVVPPQAAAALVRAQAALAAAAAALPRFDVLAPRLEGLDGLAGFGQLGALGRLSALNHLDALYALDALDALDPDDPTPDAGRASDPQDPTDSLWRAAQRALNRGDYTEAANLYGDLTRRYPNAARAGEALYWAAFALYRTDDAANLARARSLLVTQQRRYPKAATLRDGDALLARIQAALAKQGDAEAGGWISAHARASAQVDTVRAKGCLSGDDDDDVRIAALNGLLQMDAESALPILKKVLARRDACAATLRRKAVFIVSQKRGAETEDILLDAAQHDPDSEVRQQAVFWLSQVPTERAVGMLDSILKTAGDAELEEKAIFALSQQRSPRAAQILRAYAERADARPEAREKAIFWLGQQHSAENAAFLRTLYAKLTNDDLKEKVIFSLSQGRSSDNARWLMELAVNEHESIEMRKKALFWAGQSGGDLTELTGLYDRMQNTEMKEQLIFVFSQRHEAPALDKLIEIAKTEREGELRKKAIFWLGQSHDPRAAQVLLEIINQ